MTLMKFSPAILAFGLFACSSTPSDEMPAQDQVIEAAQIQKQWILVEVDGDSIDSNVKSTLHIDSKLKATGSLGCNRFFGNAELVDNTLIVNRMGSTRRMCNENANAVEANVSEILNNISKVQVSETQLILTGKEHSMKYTFRL